MTQAELLELLGILEQSPKSIPDTDNFFVNSPLFEDMLREIRVLAHDFRNGGYSKFIMFCAHNAEEKIELAAKIYEKETGKKRSTVQFSCDFIHLPGGKW